MAKVRGSVASEGRLVWISEQLSTHGAVTIAEAAVTLGVSEMTIRRDLDELELRGTARRVRGGATAAGPEPFARRTEVAARAKSQIATKLLDMVPDRGALAFDASSTVLRLASALDGHAELTVVTNGPETFAALQGTPGVTALSTGGRLDPRTGSLVGPLACRSVEQLVVDVMFASAAAVAPKAGALEATLEEAEVKRSTAARSRRVVLAVDSSKLDGRSVALSIDWDRIDVLVTELDPADRAVAPYRDLVEVR